MTTVTTTNFDTFAGTRRARLLQTAWLLTGQRTSAEDLVQVTLELTWRHWSRVQAMDSPDGYVRRTMMNAFISSRRRSWTGEAPTEVLPEVATSDAHRLAEQRHVLTDALDRLPPRQRAVVVLRYFQDLTEAQTAAAMDCSAGTVKSQLHKALKALRANNDLTDLLGEY